MKKRFLASLLTVVTTMSLFVGCKKTDSTTEEIITEVNEPVSIEMWHYLTGAQGEVLQSIIDDFNSTNGKGITVTAVNQGNITDLNKKVVAAAQSNSLPAIINVYPDLATGLIQDGKIIDLTPYINNDKIGMKDEIKNDYVKTFIDEVSQWNDGSIYGIPLTKSTEVVYVNETLLGTLGYTMNDLKNLTMEKLTEICKKSKEELDIPGFGFDSGSNAFISTLKMDGKDFIELDGTINVDNEWVREFMQYYKDNTEKGYFRTPGEDTYLSGPFSNEKLLMYQGSTAGAAHIQTNGQFVLGISEVPKFEDKFNAVIQQGASLFITNNTTPQQRYAAYEFIKYATNTENTAQFAVATGYLPVRYSAEETTIMKDVLSDIESIYGKVYQVAKEELDYAYYTPAINNAQSARNIIQEKYESYVNGSITDIDTFINDTTSQVKTSIQRQ